MDLLPWSKYSNKLDGLISFPKIAVVKYDRVSWLWICDLYWRCFSITFFVKTGQCTPLWFNNLARGGWRLAQLKEMECLTKLRPALLRLQPLAATVALSRGGLRSDHDHLGQGWSNQGQRQCTRTTRDADTVLRCWDGVRRGIQRSLSRQRSTNFWALTSTLSATPSRWRRSGWWFPRSIPMATPTSIWMHILASRKSLNSFWHRLHWLFGGGAGRGGSFCFFGAI